MMPHSSLTMKIDPVFLTEHNLTTTIWPPNPELSLKSQQSSRLAA
jgi:hypothetical protein